ncbi:cilia- and flagella-associated protein 251-like isoform X4 [Electrophorus electricus]|uniref:cilia- and flagella-associated protein 251-like isoform X4 n=1 Tax=Electrophorus electricus TaxID=8005 RepID=UPI0015D0183A|nr:cilia- and flagella-associated protein 251-like isoform X4 [Electrophorus electricus]
MSEAKECSGSRCALNPGAPAVQASVPDTQGRAGSGKRQREQDVSDLKENVPHSTTAPPSPTASKKRRGEERRVPSQPERPEERGMRRREGDEGGRRERAGRRLRRASQTPRMEEQGGREVEEEEEDGDKKEVEQKDEGLAEEEEEEKEEGHMHQQAEEKTSEDLKREQRTKVLAERRLSVLKSLQGLVTSSRGRRESEAVLKGRVADASHAPLDDGADSASQPQEQQEEGGSSGSKAQEPTADIQRAPALSVTDSMLYRLHGDIRISMTLDNPDMRWFRGSEAIMFKASMLYYRFKNLYLTGDAEDTLSPEHIHALQEAKEREERERASTHTSQPAAPTGIDVDSEGQSTAYSSDLQRSSAHTPERS